jgi:hypothetical protein
VVLVIFSRPDEALRVIVAPQSEQTSGFLKSAEEISTSYNAEENMRLLELREAQLRAKKLQDTARRQLAKRDLEEFAIRFFAPVAIFFVAGSGVIWAFRGFQG